MLQFPDIAVPVVFLQFPAGFLIDPYSLLAVFGRIFFQKQAGERNDVLALCRRGGISI